MRSEKLRSILDGIWAFCSFVFVAQWTKKIVEKKLCEFN